MIRCPQHGLRIWTPAVIAAVLLLTFSPAQGRKIITELAQSGKALYEKACAACHGVDGTGAPSRLGFDVSPPDFTDCDFATREAGADWISVAAKGGPVRGFSRFMPAFGDALTRSQFQKILEYIRTFCTNKDWPRGELNLPRPLVTTKAYPEDELVVTMDVNTHARNSVRTEIIYEQRFGARNQLELILPYEWAERSDPDGRKTAWESSVGDIGIGVKRVFYHNLEKGAILSAGGEVFFPTGDDDEGFGSGTTIFEPYLAYGQILPADFFLHFQGGLALPLDDENTNEKAFWRGVLGWMFTTGEHGRTWSPMVEILGSEEMVSGAATNWDVTPQFQVALNRRQHVRLAAGARIPMNDKDIRETEYIVYVLWDWFDGGFFEGW